MEVVIVILLIVLVFPALFLAFKILGAVFSGFFAIFQKKSFFFLALVYGGYFYAFYRYGGTLGMEKEVLLAATLGVILFSALVYFPLKNKWYRENIGALAFRADQLSALYLERYGPLPSNFMMGLADFAEAGAEEVVQDGLFSGDFNTALVGGALYLGAQLVRKVAEMGKDPEQLELEQQIYTLRSQIMFLEEESKRDNNRFLGLSIILLGAVSLKLFA